jgi:DNA-binding NarL/FixJ family response regulator
MKILVADDHAVFRDGLRTVLGDFGEAVELFEAADAAQAIDIATRHKDLDLVLMDLQMPGGGGIEGLRRFRRELPTLPVVIVSASESAAEMRRVIEGGASGFIPKSFGRKEMVAALRLVLAGGVFVPQAALAAPKDGSLERRRQRTEKLTGRQLEVLSLMARGLTNREICDVLAIAENTVKSHVKSILEALEATNRTEAAVIARELGLKAPGEE